MTESLLTSLSVSVPAALRAAIAELVDQKKHQALLDIAGHDETLDEGVKRQIERIAGQVKLDLSLERLTTDRTARAFLDYVLDKIAVKGPVTPSMPWRALLLEPGHEAVASYIRKHFSGVPDRALSIERMSVLKGQPYTFVSLMRRVAAGDLTKIIEDPVQYDWNSFTTWQVDRICSKAFFQMRRYTEDRAKVFDVLHRSGGDEAYPRYFRAVSLYYLGERAEAHLILEDMIEGLAGNEDRAQLRKICSFFAESAKVFEGRPSNYSFDALAAAEPELFDRYEMRFFSEAILAFLDSTGDVDLIAEKFSKGDSADRYRRSPEVNAIAFGKSKHILAGGFVMPQMAKSASKFLLRLMSEITGMTAYDTTIGLYPKVELVEAPFFDALQKDGIVAGHIAASERNLAMIETANVPVLVTGRHPVAAAYSHLRMMLQKEKEVGARTHHRLEVNRHRLGEQGAAEAVFWEYLDLHIAWLNGWLAYQKAAGRARVQIVHYEDLGRRRESIFGGFLSSVGIHVDTAETQEIFGQLSNRMGRDHKEGRMLFHFNEGRNDAWRDSFTPEEQARVVQRVRDALNPAYERAEAF